MTLTLRDPVAALRRPRARSAIFLVFGTVLVALALADSVVGRLVAIIIAFVLAVRWPVGRLIAVMLVIFVAIDDPAANPYNGLWQSPVQEVGAFWYNTISKSVPFIPIPVAPMLLIPMIVAWRAFTDRAGRNLQRQKVEHTLPRTFGQSWAVAIGVVVVMMAWGVATGGNVQQIYYQILGIIIALCLAVATARVSDPQLSSLIWKIILFSALYRAGLAIYIYLTIARGIVGDPPLYLTSHGDSILWAVALIMVVSQWIEKADHLSRQTAALTIPILLLAIIVNNRRLAWVVVLAALVYVTLSASNRAYRRLLKISGLAVPLLMFYVTVGLAAPPARIFAPVQALESVVIGEDSSTQTRGIEDFNLIFSTKQAFPFPAGYGKPYTEYVVAYDISATFAQYLYLPHNSVLGMLHLVGPVGFALLLAPLAICVHACHRLRRSTQDPDLRTQTALVVTTWIAYLLMGWGDLGLFSSSMNAMVGVACGVGLGLFSYYRRHGLREQLE